MSESLHEKKSFQRRRLKVKIQEDLILFCSFFPQRFPLLCTLFHFFLILRSARHAAKPTIVGEGLYQ
jgi:hypothetical protein